MKVLLRNYVAAERSKTDPGCHFSPHNCALCGRRLLHLHVTHWIVGARETAAHVVVYAVDDPATHKELPYTALLPISDACIEDAPELQPFVLGRLPPVKRVTLDFAPAREATQTPPVDTLDHEESNLVYAAWSLIANAYDGAWSDAPKGWEPAARTFQARMQEYTARRQRAQPSEDEEREITRALSHATTPWTPHARILEAAYTSHSWWGVEKVIAAAFDRWRKTLAMNSQDKEP